jgi:hypothetical protein
VFSVCRNSGGQAFVTGAVTLPGDRVAIRLNSLPTDKVSFRSFGVSWPIRRWEWKATRRRESFRQSNGETPTSRLLDGSGTGSPLVPPVTRAFFHPACPCNLSRPLKDNGR